LWPPLSQLVHETLPASAPDPKSTDEEDQEDDREDEGICYYSDSEYGDTEDEKKPGGVYEVTPKLDSGSTTPTKPRPVPAPNVRACSKIKSPGDTPGRQVQVVVRQNATDLMDEEVHRWVVAAAEPRKELLF
jgi:hypothetical protein